MYIYFTSLVSFIQDTPCFHRAVTHLSANRLINNQKSETSCHCISLQTSRDCWWDFVKWNHTCTGGLCNTNCTFQYGWSQAEDRESLLFKGLLFQKFWKVWQQWYFFFETRETHRNNKLFQSQRDWWTDIFKHKKTKSQFPISRSQTTIFQL